MRGSVMKRGEKRYSIVYRVNGKQVWRSGYTTKKAAEDALEAADGTIDSGTYVKPTKVTFGDFLEREWLPSVGPRRCGRPPWLCIGRTSASTSSPPLARPSYSTWSPAALTPSMPISPRRG